MTDRSMGWPGGRPDERADDAVDPRDLALVDALFAARAGTGVGEGAGIGAPGIGRAGEDFLARVLTDALDEQDRIAAAPPALAQPSGPVRARRGPAALAGAVLDTLRGGWQVAGGLATAGLAGLWLGFAAPGLASGLTAATSDEALALIPSYEVATNFLDPGAIDAAGGWDGQALGADGQ
ncbi:hypothetical protein [Frigidibacter sp. MR17.24]|uniref:hypothetical protein n=1 Tax=Frigidibacter sp. MR17.24 TaxID=3127345 RepID=UPI0030130D4C